MPDNEERATITDALDFFNKINSSNKVTVKFVKKDNTMRIMNCTLDFEIIPRDKRPKNVNVPRILSDIKKYGLLRVYDLDKQDWRSIPFTRVEYLETPQKIYNIIPR